MIDYFNGKLPAKGKDFITTIEPAVSVITYIELLSNKNIPQREWQQIQDFTQIAVIYALENKIVERTITLRQNHKLKTPDAIIAVTALTQKLMLITRNVADFKNISTLKVIDPHSI